jgi:hypothetical protein
VCVYTYIHTYKSLVIHVDMLRSYVYLCIYIRIHIYTHIHTREYMRLYTYRECGAARGTWRLADQDPQIVWKQKRPMCKRDLCSFCFADPHLVWKQKRPMYVCMHVYVYICIHRTCGAARGSGIWQHRIRSGWEAAQCCRCCHPDQCLLLEGIVCVLGVVVS